MSSVSALQLLSLLLPVVSLSAQWTTGTWTTGYWDCCKPSCSWPGKGNTNHPVPSCHKQTGLPISNPNERSVCDGGDAGTCADHQPFAVNDGLSMGFTAAAVGGVSGLNGDENCGQCYELQFTGEVHMSGGWPWGGSHPDLVGKSHVVQVTNIGYDVSGVHSFDLQIPSAGMGQFQAGCPNQYPGYGSNAFDCGTHYGGCSSKDGCRALPAELQRGCEWRFDWYKWLVSGGKTNNPYVRFRRVRCPTQLTDITGTVPTDDDNYPSINVDDYDSGSRRSTSTSGSVDSSSTLGPSTTPASTSRNYGQCSPAGEDCRGTNCCSDDSLTCYEKNEWWASCRASCIPGINPEDPPEFRTPWTCSNLDSTAATASPSTTEAPASTASPITTDSPSTTDATSTTDSSSTTDSPSTTNMPSTTESQSTANLPSTTDSGPGTNSPSTIPPATCSGIEQDCRGSQCCSDASLTCYSKNQWWAECRASCTPGIDPTDPIEFQTPWSCVPLPLTASTTIVPSCTLAGYDRWGPNLDGCCSGLEACIEARPLDDNKYCPPSDDRHGQSCWSVITICREHCAQATSPTPQCSGLEEDCRSTQCCSDPSHACYSKNEWWAACRPSCTPGIDPKDPVQFQTPWSCTELPAVATTPAQCSVGGTDRWGPNLGGCCAHLQECSEARSTTDDYYCAPNDSRHGVSCWSTVVVCRSACTPERRLQEELMSWNAVEVDASTVGSWSGMVPGLLASASAISLSILLGSFMMRRCQWSLKSHQQSSLVTNLGKVFPEMEDDAREAYL